MQYCSWEVSILKWKSNSIDGSIWDSKELTLKLISHGYVLDGMPPFWNIFRGFSLYEGIVNTIQEGGLWSTIIDLKDWELTCERIDYKFDIAWSNIKA